MGVAGAPHPPLLWRKKSIPALFNTERWAHANRLRPLLCPKRNQLILGILQKKINRNRNK
jgi:hypothetical protein